MEQQILFTEKQSVRQWWIWLFLLAINAFFMYGTYRQVIGGQQFGDNPMSNSGLLLYTGIFMLLTVLMYFFQLITHFTKEGIYLKYFPFQQKYKAFKWQDIAKAEVRTYQPLREYWGWGIRYGSKGMAYTLSGNQGLQLTLKDGAQVLIGTNQAEKLTEILQTIQH